MDGLEKRAGWPLARKALACLVALSIAFSVPLPREQAAADEGLTAAQIGGIGVLEGDEEEPDEPELLSGVYEDPHTGIRWVWQQRADENGKGIDEVNISGRQNAPEEDGLDWVIPGEIEGMAVTSMVGSTMGPGNWFFNGGNANTITFPATIREFRDTWGQCFLTSVCFSGYENAAGRVYFQGPCPEDINWTRDIASSDLKMTLYTDPAYVDAWNASLPQEWSKTKFKAYTFPERIEAQDAAGNKIEEIDIPVDSGVLVHAVTLPNTEYGFNPEHSKIKWSSDNDAVSVWNQDGHVYTLARAHAGDTATITMENGLFQTYSFKVNITEEVKDPAAKDANGVTWRYRDNEDGETVSITELVNKTSYENKDIVVPRELAGKRVTRIYGQDYYSERASVFQDVNARSVTFPETIEAIDDTSTNFFYNMVHYDYDYHGKIFFLGDEPPVMDWDLIVPGGRGPSGLTVKSIQAWKDAGCPWYGAYAYEIQEYEGPTGVKLQMAGVDAPEAVTVPLGTGAQLSAVATPHSEAYYAGHVKTSWSSDSAKVAVSKAGAVTTAAGAQAGDKATVTATTALGYTASIEVTVGEAPAKTAIDASWANLKDGFSVYAPGGTTAHYPALVVTDPATGAVLVEGTDYKVSYRSGSTVLSKAPIAAGDYTLVIEGAGVWYEGAVELAFTVTRERVPVAGWDYAVEGGDVTIKKYEGAEAGTLVVPGMLGGKRVTKIAAGAFDGTAAKTLVVPDSVTEAGDLSGAAFATVRFLGAAPVGVTAATLPADAKVQAFAAHADSFGGIETGTPVEPWKYYVSLDLKGNATGVLGSAAKEPAPACQIASDFQKDLALPTSIDGVKLTTVGERALASADSDSTGFDFNVVTVPAQYAAVSQHSFDKLNAALVFKGRAPEKLGAEGIALGTESLGLPEPEIIWPADQAGWTAAVKLGGWANAYDRGSYDSHYDFTFIYNELPENKIAHDAYITGYAGKASGVWKYPYADLGLQSDKCIIGWQSLGGFKDSEIDATNVTSITVPSGVDEFIGTAFTNVTCDEIFFDTLYSRKVPVATDYEKAFLGPDGKKYRGALAVPASDYQEWKNSEWANHYEIKIHMEDDPALFTYQKVVGGLAVTGYRGIEKSVAVPSFVDGVEQGGVEYSGEVVAIADGAFEGSNIEAVDVPGSVRTVGNYAFHTCTDLYYVNLQEGVQGLGKWCFWGCSALKSLTLPASLGMLGEAPFGVSGLQDVYVNDGSPLLESKDGVLYTTVQRWGEDADGNTIDGRELVYYPFMRAQASYTVEPDTVSIGRFAFRGASDEFVDAYALKKVVLPEGLREIKQFAFQQFDELVSTNIPSTVERLGENAFQSCTKLESIEIPETTGITVIPEGFVSFCESIAEIDVPDGVTMIAEDAFFSMGSLRKLRLPEGLTSIGTRAVAGCTQLSDVTLPHSLKSVGASAFVADTSIGKLGLENTSLEFIGEGAFAGLSKVREDITLPATLKSIERGAFSGMGNVKQVKFAKGFSMTELSDSVFANMTGLEWITIPACVQKVGANLFYETAVQREDPDSIFHCVFLNRGDWKCDDEQTTFSHMYDTIQRGYIYGYTSSSTKKNISDANGDLFTGLTWRPIDVEVKSEWEQETTALPGEEVRLAVNASTKNGDLTYEWEVDGRAVEGENGDVLYVKFDGKGSTHPVTVKVCNSLDPDNYTTKSTLVKVVDSADMVYPISRAKVAAVPVQVYTGSPVKPELTVTFDGEKLVKGKDYTVDYANNGKPGTGRAYVTGIGRFAGSKEAVVVEFTIVGATASTLTEALAEAMIDRADVTASDDGVGLAAGTWYAPKAVCASFDAAIEGAGEALLASKPTQAQITAAAKKLQTARSAFDAAKKQATGKEKPKVSSVKVSVKDQTWTGKALTPALTVKSGSKTLVKGKDYTIKFSNNKDVGTAKATITGIGAWTGTKAATFKINPKGTTVKALSGAKSSMKVTLNKQVKQTTGYEISVATNKKFTAGVKAVKVKASAGSATVKGLKAKTAYYVKVRTYKTVGKATYYSGWSAVKSAKTK